jgi:hypothetical protein
MNNKKQLIIEQRFIDNLLRLIKASYGVVDNDLGFKDEEEERDFEKSLEELAFAVDAFRSLQSQCYNNEHDHKIHTLEEMIILAKMGCENYNK